MTTALDSIELQVQSAIRAVDNRWREIPESDVAWTRAIKKALVEAGKAQSFAVCTADIKTADQGAWIHALCWIKRNEKGLLAEFPLALEVNWVPNDAMFVEFQRLVASKAQHRTMLFWAVSEGAAAALMARFIDQISRFRGSIHGDRYFFGYYVGSDQPMQFRLHLHR